MTPHTVTVSPQDARQRHTQRHNAVFAILLLLLLGCMPKLALAASSCRITPTVTISATSVAFGNYDPFAIAATPGTGTITVSATCNRSNLPFTVNYSIALSTGSSGNFTPWRTMKFGANTLQYNLYTTTGLSTIWGDGTEGTQAVSDQITGTCQRPGGRNCSGLQNDTVYGNIPAMQNVLAGSYADSINVTVNF